MSAPTIAPTASDAAPIRAELSDLDARETALRSRLAELRADLVGREASAARALISGDGGSATSKLAPLREEIATTERALGLLDQRRDELRPVLRLAELRDKVAEWLVVEGEIAEREARIRELFAPLAEYESLAWDFPTLHGGRLQALYARREILRQHCEASAPRLGVDLSALREDLANARRKDGPLAD